jgi:hypothetical protein
MDNKIDNKIDILALIVASAYYHPNIEFRNTLQDRLEREFKTKEEINDLLINEKGTELEPFSLTKEDINCASLLCSLAFSKLGKQTRLRIISRNTIGSDGGLVITSNLKSFYLKRYNKNSDGKPYGQPKHSWSFVPSLVPKEKSEYKTYLVPDKNGFIVKSRIPESPVGIFVCQSSYRQHGYIGETNNSLDKLGLKLEINNWEMSIRSGSPESTIRLMAYMSKGASLYLKGDDPEIADIRIKLEVPQDKRITLKSTISSTPSYCNWLGGKCSKELINKIDPSQKEIEEISTWLLPHKEWISY